MPVVRVKLLCPWCGVKLKTMDTAARVQAKLAPGSRIEKSVARCPSCAKIVKISAPRENGRRLKVWSACRLGIAVLLLAAYLFLRA